MLYRRLGSLRDKLVGKGLEINWYACYDSPSAYMDGNLKISNYLQCNNYVLDVFLKVMLPCFSGQYLAIDSA